jgi:hypothetical protein
MPCQDKNYKKFGNGIAIGRQPGKPGGDGDPGPDSDAGSLFMAVRSRTSRPAGYLFVDEAVHAAKRRDPVLSTQY